MAERQSAKGRARRFGLTHIFLLCWRVRLDEYVPAFVPQSIRRPHAGALERQGGGQLLEQTCEGFSVTKVVHCLGGGQGPGLAKRGRMFLLTPQGSGAHDTHIECSKYGGTMVGNGRSLRPTIGRLYPPPSEAEPLEHDPRCASLTPTLLNTAHKNEEARYG